ncbi:alpha/beta fold hydrolase [Mesorhizobium sp. J428]|uniref:alpha/beta fold hydrolase n=1 Tax=Mesorhizobium sp. J428 TaxID=2898440 RepID=UPI002151567B|nr:alpha/beta hydrolase [Mesorhizobium sp. J428]MCR5859495.1 alpha/beta fold hydrolase [Mesorhizobium sp. J428]
METIKTVRHGGLEFSTGAFGDAADPAILMIMGATVSKLWWPEDLCEALAATGRFVIRYDNRDTGQSTTGVPGNIDYSMDDMADDALAILDAYGIERAHLVGVSLGAMIGQLAALKQPGRVLTLTAISSSRFDEDDPSLPDMDPALMAHYEKMADLDWSDRDAVVDFQVENYRISPGADAAFDREAARSLAEREYDRARNPQSAMNHSMLVGGDAWRGMLGRITVPALVIHGRHDPILSFQHAERLADALPNAKLVALEQAGHELNPRDWPIIVSSIERLTRPD